MQGASGESIKRLIAKPKPAFAAEGFVRDENGDRPFVAVFDRDRGWMIKRPDVLELTTEGRTILVKDSEVEAIEMPTAVNNDVKGTLDGRRIAYLEQASFEELDRAEVAGRRCLHVIAHGLRADDDAPLDLHVDEETGAILRVTRESRSLEITSFRVGRIVTPVE